MESGEQREANKRRLKRMYRELHRDLANKLVALFPIMSEMPEDEYDEEARMILARVDEADSPKQLADVIRAVFADQFDEEYAAHFSCYDQVAEWLWDTCRERGMLNR